MKGAVFLDRDGTVNEEFGYINHIERFRMFPYSASAVRRLNQAAIPVVLVTNQAGVAMGYFPEELVKDIHNKLEQELASAGARFDAIYYCPHHPNATVNAYRRDCACRKPSPGMLERAAVELRLDLKSSYVIGDRFRDIETAIRVGARGVLVLSGYGKGEYLYQRESWPRMPDYVAEDLYAAVDWVLQDVQQGKAGLLQQAD